MTRWSRFEPTSTTAWTRSARRRRSATSRERPRSDPPTTRPQLLHGTCRLNDGRSPPDSFTAVASGTSLPEIAVSVAAVRRGAVEIAVEIAVGNVLGSNVFNAFAVMGVPSLIAPVAVPESVRGRPPGVVLATVLYYFITQDRELTVWEDVVVLVLYAAFLANLATVT